MPIDGSSSTKRSLSAATTYLAAFSATLIAINPAFASTEAFYALDAFEITQVVIDGRHEFAFCRLGLCPSLTFKHLDGYAFESMESN